MPINETKEKVTLTFFIAKSKKLNTSEKALLIVLVNSRAYDSFTDDLHTKVSESLTEVFSEAYVNLEDDARKMTKGVMETAERIVGGLPK